MVWRFGGLAVWRFGGLAVWRFGGLAVWWFGGLVVWWFGGLVVWWRRVPFTLYKNGFSLENGKKPSICLLILEPGGLAVEEGGSLDRSPYEKPCKHRVLGRPFSDPWLKVDKNAWVKWTNTH